MPDSTSQLAATIPQPRASIRAPFWILLGWVAVLGGYAGVSLALPRSFELRAFGDIVQCLVPLLAVAALLWNASSADWRRNLFWTMLAAGCALWMFGQLMWTYFEVGLRQDVPNPFLGDVVFFLHVVPMFVALALMPHAGKSDLNVRLSTIDFALVLQWWLYLYLFVVIPWQYIFRSDALYGRSFDDLYGIESLVLAAGMGALVAISHGAWKKIYAHLFGASLLYAVASTFINHAIDRGRYHTGSLYDLPLLASFLWFATAGVVGHLAQSAPDPLVTAPGQHLASRFAMGTVLSMPPMAFWCIWGSAAPHSVKVFRLAVTQGAILAAIGLISLRRWIVDRDRLRLLGSLQESVDRLQRLQSRLVQSEKLASLGHLAAGAAHEINNPLTGILGYSEMLLDDETLNDKPRATAQKIRELSLRIKKLVTSLLSFSRQVPAEKTPVDLVLIVNNALQLGSLGARQKNIEIEVKAESKLPKVRGDADQLLRVFFNLIDNAADAMQETGGGVLDIQIFLERGKVVAEFSDTGPGMKDPLQVFDPFYTTKPAGKGTGLGLSLCYGIVKEHGGELTCQNRPEGGAKFRVELPAPMILGEFGKPISEAIKSE